MMPPSLQGARELRECRRTVLDLENDLTRARAEIKAVRGRSAAFALQLDQAVDAEPLQDATAAQLRRDVAELTATLAAQREAEAALHREIAALHVQIAGLSVFPGEIQALRQSTSWRVTRPLRAISRPGRTLRFLLRRVLGR